MGVMIVGAGVAGLTLGHELVRAGQEVTVVEILPEIGGLARSFRYGDFVFDLGPHRFHTENAEVESFIRAILGANQADIRRSSGVWFFDRYHDWPLKPSSLLKIPKREMLKACLDLFFRPRPRSESFEDYVLARYGRTIYRLFFKPYTEKFIKYRCDQLHHSWAKAGINRAVIEKRLEVSGIWNLVRGTLFPQKVDTRFIYPRRGGIGAFTDALGEGIRRGGGTLLTDCRLTALRREGSRVVAAVDSRGAVHEVDHLFWTGTLPALEELLELPDFRLEYLASLFLNFEVDGEPDHEYQWIYYGGPDLVFSRASFPTRFSPLTAPPGKHGICVEIACMEGDGAWNHPEWVIGDVRTQMIRVGLVPRYTAIEDCHVEKVRHTYPIYTLGYQERKAEAARQIGQQARNISLLGRTGNFWYNNMDHSIAQALHMARKFLACAEDLSVSTEEIFQG
ncbi:MAG: FAD-dependent oxidoreductase [Planctomycetes bacterium]|nr:FAD-dependent oxidoreductase [Planctomycetota bacterium]